MTTVAAMPVPRRSIADPALPQLPMLLDGSTMKRRLEREVYGTSIDLLQIVCIRHKPGRRAVIRYEVRINGRDDRRERLFGKTFASQRGPAVYRVYEELSSTRSLRAVVDLPEPAAYLPGLNLFLQREAPGTPARNRLLAGDTRLAIDVAEAIHALHVSKAAFQRRHDLHWEVDPLRGRVARLAAACPSLAGHAHDCLELVERGCRMPWLWRWRPVHRDFYHDQVLVNGQRLAILDFDDAAMSEPAIDIANFAAHLHLLRAQQPDRGVKLEDARQDFFERCRDLDPEVDAKLLRFLEGATLLRLAEIHLPRQRGHIIAGDLLKRSLDLLQTAVD